MNDYFHSPGLLVRAQVSLQQLYDMQPESLRSLGIRGVLIDLENTLIPYGATRLSVDAKEHLRCLLNAGLMVLVASNAEWSPVADELRAEGIPYRFRSWKPFSCRLSA